MNHYQLLGVTHTASLAEIKGAFKQLALKHHPDKNFGDASSEEMFKLIAEAYKTLSNGRLRKLYDDKLGLTRLTSKVNYVYHEGGFYRSILHHPSIIRKEYPKPAFQTKKKDIDFYLFWITLGMILILVAVLIVKL